MFVAEIIVVSGHHFSEPVKHVARFETVEAASATFDRIAALIVARAERKNDLPKEVTVEGIASKFTVPLDDVHSVGWTDFAKANAAMIGVKDTFPLLWPA